MANTWTKKNPFHTTLQLLMAEAFNDLFVKYGKPEIVPTVRGELDRQISSVIPK